MAVTTYVTQDCGGFSVFQWDPTVANSSANGIGNAAKFTGGTAAVSGGTSGAQPNKDRGRHVAENRTS
jgi:hypothetical protein